MKKNYLVLILALWCFVTSAQENIEDFSPKTTDIQGFKLYPNPSSSNVVYITTRDNLYKEITVYDVFGKVVLVDKIIHNTLNISRLVPGVYVMQIIENKKTITRKLVVV